MTGLERAGEKHREAIAHPGVEALEANAEAVG